MAVIRMSQQTLCRTRFAPQCFPATMNTLNNIAWIRAKPPECLACPLTIGCSFWNKISFIFTFFIFSPKFNLEYKLIYFGPNKVKI